ncbi:MAG: AarF/ABC1/UbiB kinase family protein [Actinomycetota bacterium]|nr:AarF/ABC1/UbiB kinase family protein [Actinomycetota bacterium]
MENAVPSGLLGRVGRLTAASMRTSMRVAMLGPRTLLGTDSPRRLIEETHEAAAREMMETLGRLKGASMKVGQLASFIDAGIFPPEVRDIYQNALGSLRDKAPPMRAAMVREVIREELGHDVSELFGGFNGRPAAAASLGQVHFARLHDGREAAVKIQYPGIEEAIRSDLAMTHVMRPLLPLLAPGLEAGPAMEEIRIRALEECDYLLEASNLKALAEHHDGHPFARVPRPLPELSSRRVLTMERAAGLPFAHMKRLPQAERNRIGEMLFRFYWGSLHRNGFTSADPHPGNYLLMEDGRMAFLDFGLACELQPSTRPSLLRVFEALRDRDVDGLFAAAVDLGYVSRPDRTDPERFFRYVDFSLAPIAEDREYTFTRDFIAERTAVMMDPRNEWWSFVRHLNLPRWALLLYRLELGLFAVLAQLGATANWHRMTREFYGAEPSTDLGRAEADWLHARAA